MNSATPVIDRSDQQDPEAANDDDFYSNPLWMVAVAFACLFTLLAFLLASG